MLERIQKANDIKKLAPEELPELAQEIRQFLIEKISRTGGHLASNLGVVELTMAIHLVFDLPLIPPYFLRSSNPSFLPVRILCV